MSRDNSSIFFVSQRSAKMHDSDYVQRVASSVLHGMPATVEPGSSPPPPLVELARITKRCQDKNSISLVKWFRYFNAKKTKTPNVLFCHDNYVLKLLEEKEKLLASIEW